MQSLEFLPNQSRDLFVSASDVTKRTTIDKVVQVWDFAAVCVAAFASVPLAG